MKRIIAILLSVMMLLSLAACQEAQDPNEAGNGVPVEYATPGTIGTDFEGVNLEVLGIEIVDGKTTLKTKWVNNTDYSVIYGAAYNIERQEDGEWVSCLINENLGFIDIAYELGAKSANAENYNLTGAFDISVPGTYRISSKCYVHDMSDGEGSTECNLWAEFSVLDTEETDIKDNVELEFEAQYIRTNGEHDGIEHFVVRSVEELQTYYEQNKDKHDLERRENPASDYTVGFLDACDAYNEEFFEENALIMVLLEEGSGSIRHKVAGVSVLKSEMRLLAMEIAIESIVPEAGTDDMAGWHILIAVDKDELPKDDADIEILYNEDKPRNITHSKGCGSIFMVLQKGWEYEIVDGDGVAFGIDIWPEGESEGKICVNFYNGFGVCGTGLKQETITIAGYEAWQGTYDNARWWDFIVLKDAPGDYVVQNQGADSWLSEHEDELMQILGSLRIADNVITKEEAIKFAVLEAEVEYENVIARFDAASGAWNIALYLTDTAGEYREFTVSADGSKVEAVEAA